MRGFVKLICATLKTNISLSTLHTNNNKTTFYFCPLFICFLHFFFVLVVVSYQLLALGSWAQVLTADSEHD